MNQEIRTILLIRHARSTANEDPTVYRTTPDHTIPLCRPDDDDAAQLAGDIIARLALDPASVCSWSSTYLRCVQTERLVIAHAFGPRAPEVRQRPSFLLREQEFGDWDCLTEEEMEAADPVRYAKRQRLTDNQGRFYFRYPNGESRADVTQRIAIFIGKIHRSRYAHHLVFLHGVTQRAFRMAWLNRTVDWFEEEPNPPNVSVLMIQRDAEGFWADRYL
ncbi:MAG TPA: phosphoglycerate mutase family protein [Candidatus Nanopelagicales bacterium]|nr:phosphoglycerate mutase family protein [Candidatus Nanopelagicales bacterium]